MPLTAQQTRTRGPTRYEEDVQAFEAQDAATPPPANAIVITGSSSIRRWHPRMADDLAPLTVIPRGFGGSTMADLLYYLDRLVITYRPRAVVIYEGDNDMARGGPAEPVLEQFNEIVDRIHSALPDTRIYVISVKPSLDRWDVWPEFQRANEMLQAVAADDDRVQYIDMASALLQPDGEVMPDIFVDDGLHLNEKGTDIWAAKVREALMPTEARYESTDR
jgi:lysophospholipase L1-like esterase